MHLHNRDRGEVLPTHCYEMMAGADIQPPVSQGSEQVRKVLGFTVNRSCEACWRAKKRCNSDGINPCSRCRKKGEAAARSCVYPARKPNSGRRRRDRQEGSDGSLPAPSRQARARAQGDVANPLVRPSSRGSSMKRYSFVASPATGLVGMEENTFLAAFFTCVGFYPFACNSNIRKAMVELMTASMATQQQQQQPRPSRRGSASSDIPRGAAATDSSEGVVGPGQRARGVDDVSTCMFWSAVATGALVRGRSLDSVRGYVRLAEEASERNVTGRLTLEMSRASAMMAYLYSALGDHTNFVKCMESSDASLSDCPREEISDGMIPMGFPHLVRSLDNMNLMHCRYADAADLEAFCAEKDPALHIHEVATEGEVAAFVLHSYRSFHRAFFNDVLQEANAAVLSDRDNVGAVTKEDFFVYSKNNATWGKKRQRASILVPLCGEEALGTAGVLERNMLKRLRGFSREYERLEEAVARTTIAPGIGGIVINSSLVFSKIARHDLEGARENLARGVEVQTRFPGACRLPVLNHVIHKMLATLAAMGLAELYEQARAAYNPHRPAGSLPVPPLEEWTGVGAFCNHVYCRAWERVAMSWDKVDDDDDDDDDDEDEVPTPSANVIGHRHDGDDRSAQGCSNGFPGALTPGVMRNHQREVDSASSTASFTSEDASPAMSSYSGGESLSCTKRNGCCDDDVRDNDSNETEMARSPEGVKSCGSAMPRTVFGAALNTRREKDSGKEIPHMFTVGAGASGARGPSAVSREVLNGDASLPRMRPTHPSSLVQGTCVSFRAPSAEVDMLGGAVLSGYEGSSAQGRVGHENHESHPSGIIGPRKWPLNNALNYENAGAAMQEEGGMVARRSGMSAAGRGAEVETQLAEGMVRPGSQMAASSRSTEVDVHLSIEELLGVSTVGTETRDDEIQTACSSMSLSHRAAMVATSAPPSLLQRRESTSLGVPSADRSGCALPAGVEGFAAPNPSTAGGLFGSDPSTAAESRHDVEKGYSFNLLKPPGMTLDKQRYGWGFDGNKRQRSMPQADHGSGGSAASSGEPSVMESSAATTSGDRASSRKGVDQAIVSTNLSTDTLAFGFGKAVGGCLASRAGYTRPAGRGAGECLGRTFALQPSASLAYLTKTNRPQTGSSRDPVGSGFIVENTSSSGLVENGKEAVSSCRR